MTDYCNEEIEALEETIVGMWYVTVQQCAYFTLKVLMVLAPYKKPYMSTLKGACMRTF